MKQLVWLDLCSGLGGASQPALDRGWKVIRVDIDPRFKPDIVADVRRLPLKPFHVDVLWASPPCQEFSKFGLRCFYPNPPKPDLSIAEGISRAIAKLQPRHWAVENVLPSRPWLNKIFGQVRAAVPGHAVWSDVPLLLPNILPHKTFSARMGHKYKQWSAQHAHLLTNAGRGSYGLSPSQASSIPYEIGECICAAVERTEAEA